MRKSKFDSWTLFGLQISKGGVEKDNVLSLTTMKPSSLPTLVPLRPLSFSKKLLRPPSIFGAGTGG